MELQEKSLMELSNQELEKALKVHANRNVIFSYNDVRLEIERRAQQNNADRVYKLSILAIIISVVSLFASVLVAIFN